MLKVVVTGASGFIGSHLCRSLVEQGYSVTAICRSQVNPVLSSTAIQKRFCDLRDATTTTAVLRECSPDFLIHLASRPLPSRDLNDFDSQLQDTLIPALNVARYCPDNLRLALFFGSCEEYGNAKPPFSENSQLNFQSPYGWAKVSAFHAVSLIARQRNLPMAWIRPFLTYGEGQNTSQLIPTLIRECVQDNKVPLTPAEQTRDFVYIKDLCRMIELILRDPHKAAGQSINLCSGQSRTVKSTAELIQKIAGGGELLFGSIPYRDNESMEFYGSFAKFESLYGKFDFTDFESSLSETIKSQRMTISQQSS